MSKIGKDKVPRPAIEYLLTSTCGSPNYGNRSAPEMKNANSSKYLDGPIRSQFYQRAINYGSSTQYPHVIAPDNALDVFGVGIGYHSFTLAGFFYRPSGTGGHAGAVWNKGTNVPPWTWGATGLKILLWSNPTYNSKLLFAYANQAESWTVGMQAQESQAFDNWIYFVNSFDGSTLRQYMNGVLKAQGSLPVPINSNNPVYVLSDLNFILNFHFIIKES